jgi:cysteine desulfurase
MGHAGARPYRVDVCRAPYLKLLTLKLPLLYCIFRWSEGAGRDGTTMALINGRKVFPLMPQVFLDYQSATPLHPRVLESMLPFFREQFGNPSSLHRYGLQARDALAKAREQVAGLIRATSAEEILFTSGGTEAMNLAVKGVAYAERRRGNHLVVSAIEHPAVLNSVEILERDGFSCTRVGVDGEGRIDPEAIRAAMRDETILVAAHHVNHDIGTIEPIRAIGEIAAERGVAFFVDATVSGGWHPVDVEEMGASLLALSPHRFYGPKGAGILYRNRRTRIAAILHGGVQEGGRRAGTENVPAWVGAGMAAELAKNELAVRMEATGKRQRQLWEGVRSQVPYLRLNGPEPGRERISTNLNLSVEFLEGEGLALALDFAGVAVASGPSCVNKSLKISHVLSAIGLESDLAQGNVVFSLGKETTEEEIELALETFSRTVKKLRGMSSRWEEFEAGKIDSLISPRNGSGENAGCFRTESSP